MGSYKLSMHCVKGGLQESQTLLRDATVKGQEATLTSSNKGNYN